MKKYILPVIQSAFILLALSFVNTANCQSGKDKDLMEDASAGKTDFIHKMKIAAKETSETLYWFVLCERSEGYYFDIKLKTDLEEIIRILSKIISTSKS